MNKEEKELLEKHRKSLIGQMSTEDLLDDLVEDDIFDNETKGQIEEMATSEERAERLLKTVMESKNPKAMQSFLTTLERTHKYLYVLLKPSGQPDSRPVTLVPIDQHVPQISSPPLNTSSTTYPKEFYMELNEKQLWEISALFRVTGWQNFGRELDVPEATIAEIKMNHGTNLRESAYQQLLVWKEMYPEKCTIATLCEALQKLGQNGMVKKLEKLYADVLQNIK